MKARKVPVAQFAGDRRARGTFRVCPAHRDTLLESFGGGHHDPEMGWCPECEKGVKPVLIRQR